MPISPRIIFLRSNPIAPDPRVEREAFSLNSLGYSVSILGWDRTAKLKSKEVVNGISITRISIEAPFGHGIGNLPQLLRWQWHLLKWLITHHEDFEIIHACDFDTILPAIYCQKVYKKLVVYDIFDFYADHLRSTPGWIKEIIRRVDYWVIQQSDAVIIVDDSRLSQLGSVKPSILEVIYNSPRDIQNRANPAVKSKKTDRLHLAYIGLLQVERGLLEILNVLCRNPQWSLDLAGFGGDQDIILNLARELPNVTWHGRIPYEKTLQLSQDADVLIATYDPEIPNHRYASPNKIFEAMMLGKPIIVAKGTNIDGIVQEHKCGMIMIYGNEADLEHTLDYLAKNPKSRNEMGLNARKAYENVYGWDQMEKRLLKLYQRITCDK